MKHNILASIGLIGIGIVLGIILISNLSPESANFASAQEIGRDSAPVAVGNHAKAIEGAVSKASEAVTPAVVSISVEVEGTRNRFNEEFREFFKFFGRPDNEDNTPRRSEASGSGVFVTNDGYIVTNNHVVENAIDDGITITTYDKKVYKNVKLVGTDPLTDLALLKIEDTDDIFPAVHLADMENVAVGDFVLAVGNPLGLNSTVTFGIISAIGRGQIGGGFNRDRYSVENYIQTDAAINPGNSGGGLFNLEGSLVGINTAIATRTGTYIGYGFAIPVDLVKSVIGDLIDDGRIDRGYIGVSIRTVNESVAKAVGLDKVAGVLVHNILDGSPAAKAGLEPGDIILELDGKPLATSQELQSEIVLRRAGDKVKLIIWRDQEKITKTVTLQPRDDDGNLSAAESPEEEEADDKSPVKFEELGFTVEPVNEQMKETFDVKQGAYVSSVKRYSPASEGGLFADGVIVKADRKKVKSPQHLKEIINKLSSGDAILIQVKYESTYQIVAIEIPES